MSTESEGSLATRPSLLARLKDWSQQTAWREFDHDYAPLIRNVARKAGLTDVEADEVTQEALLAVAKRIGEFEHAGRSGSFRAWLYQQARWRIADQFRARLRTSGLDKSSSKQTHSNQSEPEIATCGECLTADPDGEVDSGFERVWDAEWEEHVRRTAVGRVKRVVGSRQFQLFDLHVLQHMPVRDAARAAGASVAAVYMARSRVGRVLKREIQAARSAEIAQARPQVQSRR